MPSAPLWLASSLYSKSDRALNYMNAVCPVHTRHWQWPGQRNQPGDLLGSSGSLSVVTGVGHCYPKSLCQWSPQHCSYRVSADLGRRKLKWRPPLLWFRLTEQVVADFEMFHIVSLLLGLKRARDCFFIHFVWKISQAPSQLLRNSWEQPANNITWM